MCLSLCLQVFISYSWHAAFAPLVAAIRRRQPPIREDAPTMEQIKCAARGKYKSQGGLNSHEMEQVLTDAGLPLRNHLTPETTASTRRPLQALLEKSLEPCSNGLSYIEAPRFFWMDIFTVAQLRHHDHAAAWNKADTGRFAEAMEASNAVVWVHLQPWFNPTALQRVWCAPMLAYTHGMHARTCTYHAHP